MKRQQSSSPNPSSDFLPPIESTKMPLALLRGINATSSVDAWRCLLQHAWDVCSPPVELDPSSDDVANVITQRDYALCPVDSFLANACWDLWDFYESSAPLNSKKLIQWWNERPGGCESGRAVLVLDALSLREVPWLLRGAGIRGYCVHQACVHGAELPADTTPFARALGFSGRSSLRDNDGASQGHLHGASTESSNLPFADCAAQIGSCNDILYWHHWPDDRIHQLSEGQQGVVAFSRETAEQLSSDAFWRLVWSLTQGRRLVITADHGYAACGNFSEITESSQIKFLVSRYRAQRWANALSDLQEPSMASLQWIPPVDTRIKTAHTDAYFVLGRRKWRIRGGFPTLAHGGLSLLEVAVPFIELSRPSGY